MKAVICGINGFVGKHIKEALKSRGYEVLGIDKKEIGDFNAVKSKLDSADVVINLAGAPIVGRWNEEYKKILKSSRIDTTNTLVSAMMEVTNKPKLFISTSAVGWYDNRATYDEYCQNCHSDDFLAGVCEEWEKSALKAEELGIRTLIYRFGLVLGKDGGMMAKLLKPFRLGIGGTIGDGSQAMSFIHIDDLVSAELFALDNQSLKGIYNLTAPNPITNKIFTKALGKKLNRPTILPVPIFMLKIIFSDGSKVLSDGQSVTPKKLLEAGFVFKYDTIEKTLENIL